MVSTRPRPCGFFGGRRRDGVLSETAEADFVGRLHQQIFQLSEHDRVRNRSAYTRPVQPRLAASMGPHAVTFGIVDELPWRSRLQRGRARSRAETERVEPTLTSAMAASTGPRAVARGNMEPDDVWRWAAHASTGPRAVARGNTLTN